ncbi:MAG: hypothetical protein J5486_05545 [Bacteroidaceae bacterium]|nr:hypothetical protein [Bacteroidaceae bacterium]
MNSQQRILLQPRTTLEAMRAERQRLNGIKRQSRRRIADTSKRLFHQQKATTDRLGTFLNVLQTGMAIYQGVRMGASFIEALRTSIGKKAK